MSSSIQNDILNIFSIWPLLLFLKFWNKTLSDIHVHKSDKYDDGKDDAVDINW